MRLLSQATSRRTLLCHWKSLFRCCDEISRWRTGPIIGPSFAPLGPFGCMANRRRASINSWRLLRTLFADDVGRFLRWTTTIKRGFWISPRRSRADGYPPPFRTPDLVLVRIPTRNEARKRCQDDFCASPRPGVWIPRGVPLTCDRCDHSPVPNRKSAIQLASAGRVTPPRPARARRTLREGNRSRPAPSWTIDRVPPPRSRRPVRADTRRGSRPRALPSVVPSTPR